MLTTATTTRPPGTIAVFPTSGRRLKTGKTTSPATGKRPNCRRIKEQLASDEEWLAANVSPTEDVEPSEITRDEFIQANKSKIIPQVEKWLSAEAK